MAERTISTLTPEALLFNRNVALERIQREGNRYNIRNVSDLVLIGPDFEEAEKIYNLEAKIVFGESDSLTNGGIFRGAVYCLLTPFQDYSRTVEAFSSLSSKGLDIPANILENRTEVNLALKYLNLNKQKPDKIFKLALSWREFDLADEITEGVKKGRDEEIRLRKIVVKDFFGFGEKTASMLLRMCGAQYLVPVDANMANVLYFLGYPVEIGHYYANRADEGRGIKKRKSKIHGAEYLKFENFALDLAQKYNVPAYLLQLAVYTRYSTYRKTLSRNS
jgi:thermostable 8-oxoguanine DNA glycosylase